MTNHKTWVIVSPTNATRTSDFPISDDARAAYLAKLEQIDDMAIALEVRTRPRLVGNVVELEEFVREQGYDPADLTPSAP